MKKMRHLRVLEIFKGIKNIHLCLYSTIFEQNKYRNGSSEHSNASKVFEDQLSQQRCEKQTSCFEYYYILQGKVSPFHLIKEETERETIRLTSISINNNLRLKKKKSRLNLRTTKFVSLSSSLTILIKIQVHSKCGISEIHTLFFLLLYLYD